MSHELITEQPVSRMLPALIAGAGERASLRFLELFAVNIGNKNTRTAYARGRRTSCTGAKGGLANSGASSRCM
jgi:hypothetical protein